jgi:hypothetical protein
MSSLRKTLLKQVLAWAEDTLGITGQGAAPQVILAQRGEKSPRPPQPYLVLDFTTFDMPVGTVEHRWEAETQRLGGHRQAMLSIKGIGPGSDDWLQTLAFRTDLFDGDMAITTDGSGSTLDISFAVDESFEEQYLKEFLCEYHLRDSETAPTAVQTTLTVNDAAETITVTTVIDWE